MHEVGLCTLIEVFNYYNFVSRCLFTNIDPESAERDQEEPLKTLKTYRKFEKSGDSPVMGIHLGIRQQGKIKLGDLVYIGDDQ